VSATMPTILTSVESTIPEIRTRIRVNHSHTQRAGWQYETTVEVEWSGDEDGTSFSRLQDLLAVTRNIAILECEERNALGGAS
jgi:hypothetical protein